MIEKLDAIRISWQSRLERTGFGPALEVNVDIGVHLSLAGPWFAEFSRRTAVS